MVRYATYSHSEIFNLVLPLSIGPYLLIHLSIVAPGLRVRIVVMGALGAGSWSVVSRTLSLVLLCNHGRGLANTTLHLLLWMYGDDVAIGRDMEGSRLCSDWNPCPYLTQSQVFGL